MNVLLLFLLSLPLAIFAFLFEVYPRFKNRLFGVDVWTHLLYLKEYHRQKGIPKRIEGGFLVPGSYDYPPIFISILSKFPLLLVEKYEFFFSPFFDALHIILIFFIPYALTGSIFIAFLTQIFYILTPIIILENSSATPRSLGYTFFTIVFTSLILFQEKEFIFLALAILFGSLIFLSHRFTTQGFLFFSFFFVFLHKDIVYIFSFLMSFLLAIVLSKGFYLRVLQGHIGNLLFWKDNIAYRFAHQVKGNYRKSETKDFIFKLYNQFLKFPPFTLSITNPWTLPVLYMFFSSSSLDPIFGDMLWWVVFAYALALFTLWVPGLRFLGEGQRYLELAAFPAAFLSAVLLLQVLENKYGLVVVALYVILGIAAFITTLIIQRRGIINDTLRSVTLSLEKMFAYLRSLKEKPKLFCIPHQITTSTIYHTGCKVFVNASYSSIHKISDIYPYIKKPIREIMKKHDLEMILLNEDYAKANDLKMGKYKVVKKVDNFVLFKPV